MGKVLLRKANRADTVAVLKLVLSANLNPTRLDWRRFSVAVDPGGKLIGCVQMKPHRDGSMELASLVVAEDWRGKGVAHALIEDSIEKHEGWLYLMCRSGLGDFYHRFEFEVLEIGHMSPYFRRIFRLMEEFHQLTGLGEGLLIMRRECGKTNG